jgi:diguanylate cyclase (GGDEF)-like protein
MQLLRASEIFSTLGREEMEIVAINSRFKSYGKGTVIFTIGAHSNEMYIVRDGDVLITRPIDDDNIDIAQYVSGEAFGEWDFLEGSIKNTTAVAVRDTSLLVFPREGINFANVINRYPKISARILYKFLEILASRMRNAQNMINEKTPWITTLRKQLYTDKLTGLYSRYFIDDDFERMLNASSGMTSVVMIKPDDFKDLNDRFGHAAGDRILMLISIFIQSVLRTEDIAVRYHGDEFAVVLPGIGRDGAIYVAWEIGRTIYQMDLSDIINLNMNITVSIGVATYPVHAVNAMTLVAMAHDRMMRARMLGGNRMLVAK